MDVKEEDPLFLDVASQNESELFIKKKSNHDTVLLRNDNVIIKTEITSDSPFPDCSSQKETECFGNPLIDQINFETFSCSTNCKTEFKIEIGLEKKREFLPEDNKIEVKEETWWLKTGSSSAYDDMKDGAFTPVKSPRLYIESASGDSSHDSPLCSAGASMRNTNSSFGKDCLEFGSQESDFTKIPPEEKHDHSEQSHKDTHGESSRSTLLFHKDIRSYNCKNCDATFTQVSHFESHNCEVKKSHRCEKCEKGFTTLSNLRKHSLIHEGRRPHQCDVCEKSFTHLSQLKSHILIHEGKRPYKCGICEKSYTLLSRLKRHSLIHEGNRPHECGICEKRFTHLSYLKSHIVIHEGKRIHKCEICEKRFTRLSHLRRHSLIHEGDRAHKCEICQKRFTRLSHLKSHILIHEGKRPHWCEICKKSFTGLSNLKRHSLTHEGKKPHRCELCEKSFTRLSHLKSHIVLHEGIKTLKCDICGKRFALPSYLKLHYLVHQK